MVAVKSWRLADLGAKHALLLAGLGWGNMPKPMVNDDLKRGRLVALNIETPGELAYPFHTVYRSDTPPGPAASWLMERLAHDSMHELSQTKSHWNERDARALAAKARRVFASTSNHGVNDMAAKKKKKAKAEEGSAKKTQGQEGRQEEVAKKASKKPAKKTKRKKAKKRRRRVKARARRPYAGQEGRRRRSRSWAKAITPPPRKFDKDQAGFVEKNKAKIPAMGKEAEAALDGPEGDSLRDAEATAAARSRDTF